MTRSVPIAPLPPADRRPGYVRSMFGRIAGRYDCMNRLMTAGRDRVWRRCVVRAAGLGPGARLLDVGTGTGAILQEARRLQPTLRAFGADFTIEMMQAAAPVHQGRPPAWTCADALALPFADETFDAVTSGYLLRNVGDRAAALAEQVRVLRPGGRVVCLETSPPPAGFMAPLVRIHLMLAIPLLGWLVAGDTRAYRYLPASTAAFVRPGRLAAEMRRAGLRQVAWQPFMFGTIAVHVGVKGNSN